MTMFISKKQALCTMVAALVMSAMASAAGAFGILYANGLEGGARWDYQTRYFYGQERSLQRGLRYSLQGGSFQAFKNKFTWDTVPTNVQFKRTVQQAFDAWSTVDPATGLGTKLFFRPNLATRVSQKVNHRVSYGAEIDLFATKSAYSWGTGSEGLQGETSTTARYVGNMVKLTSGTTGYNSYAITGSDIWLNCNPEAVWSLAVFRLVLTHEIGHSLGLDDVDVSAGPDGVFIDDNYKDDRPATLRNSFAEKINTRNPAASRHLQLYKVTNDDKGFESSKVHILMESNIDAELIDAYPYLTNDDYAGRQFLYPFVARNSGGVNLSSGSLSSLDGSQSSISSGGLTSVQSIPEPTSVAFMLAGLLVLRRRTSRAG